MSCSSLLSCLLSSRTFLQEESIAHWRTQVPNTLALLVATIRLRFGRCLETLNFQSTLPNQNTCCHRRYADHSFDDVASHEIHALRHTMGSKVRSESACALDEHCVKYAGNGTCAQAPHKHSFSRPWSYTTAPSKHAMPRKCTSAWQAFHTRTLAWPWSAHAREKGASTKCGDRVRTGRKSRQHPKVFPGGPPP